ncbi:MAG: molybdenum cofactor guanylyltransferase [Desulfarculaceae bacterium]|jgi:molybdopterin-guanine dinucleotide biosynthesis protein A
MKSNSPVSFQKEQSPLGVILAGGPGNRLGGDKPFRTVWGKRLIDLALETLSQVCSKQVVVTSQVGAMADLPCDIIADRWPGQGPLAALATAFLDMNCDSLLVIPVDTPLVSVDLLRLVAQPQEGDRAVALAGPRGLEPLLAWYHSSCLPPALRLIEANDRRPRKLLEVVKARIIPLDQVHAIDPEGLSFLNVNFPRDLERARKIAAQKWAD